MASVEGFIPQLHFGDPGYDEYMDLIANLETCSILFLNLGLGFFLISTFLGAMTEKRFSTEVKRAMLIASVLGIIALVIFNYMILYFIIT